MWRGLKSSNDMDDAFVVQINLVMIEKRATACTVDRAAISGIGHIFEISTHACMHLPYLHVPDRSLPAFMYVWIYHILYFSTWLFFWNWKSVCERVYLPTTTIWSICEKPLDFFRVFFNNNFNNRSTSKVVRILESFQRIGWSIVTAPLYIANKPSLFLNFKT